MKNSCKTVNVSQAGSQVAPFHWNLCLQEQYRPIEKLKELFHNDNVRNLL